MKEARGCRHEVFNRSEYWRLADPTRKPPGVLGWWPSRSTTFLEVQPLLHA